MSAPSSAPVEPGKPLRAVTGLVLALLLASVWLPRLEGGATPTGLFVTHTLVFLFLAMALVAVRREGHLALGAGWEAPAGLAVLAACLLSFLTVDYLYGPFLSLWNVVVAVVFAAAMMLVGGSFGPLAAAIIALGTVAQALSVLVMPAQSNMTPSGSFANANQLAACLNIGIFVSLAIAVEAWRGRMKWRVIVGIAFGTVVLVNIAAMLRVGSRGALLALLIVGAIGALPSLPRGSMRPRLALIGGLVALTLLAAAAVSWRFERIGDPYRFDRLRIWEAGLDAAREHPVLGLGPGMFERRGYRYNFPLDREMFRYSKMPSSTHSTGLQVLAETGLVGFAATMALLGLVAARLWRLRAERAGPALAFFASLVQGLVDTTFEVPAVTFSLVALIAPLLSTRDAREAPLYVWLAWRRGLPASALRMALGTGMIAAWVGAVALPYVAWVDYAHGRIDAAIRRDAYNPLYHATSADRAWRKDRPLDPQTLAQTHIDLDEARRLDPGNPEYLLRLARLHARACFEIGADTAAVARAEGYYRDAIALGMKDPRPHLELATFLLAQGRSAPGISEIKAALDLEPRFLGARVAFVKALLDAGDRAAAAAQLTRLDESRQELSAYEAKNGYEQDLMRIDVRMLSEIETKLR